MKTITAEYATPSLDIAREPGNYKKGTYTLSFCGPTREGVKNEIDTALEEARDNLNHRLQADLKYLRDHIELRDLETGKEVLFLEDDCCEGGVITKEGDSYFYCESPTEVVMCNGKQAILAAE